MDVHYANQRTGNTLFIAQFFYEFKSADIIVVGFGVIALFVVDAANVV